MAVKANPTAAASKWQSRLSQAANDGTVAAGVQAVQTAPGQLAARNKAGYLSGVNNNVNKWATNVAAVSNADWQDATISKGVPRIATGATAAEGKFATFMGKLLPFEQNLYNSLPPRGTKDQNIQRAVSWMQGMTKFSNS